MAAKRKQQIGSDPAPERIRPRPQRLDADAAPHSSPALALQSMLDDELTRTQAARYPRSVRFGILMFGVVLGWSVVILVARTVLTLLR